MKRIRVTSSGILVAFFLVLIFLPCLASIPMVHGINRERFMDVESREPNEYPPLEFTVEGLRDFPGRFEKAFNDRFGFRRDLITLYKLLMFKVFNISTDRGNVVIGRDGWLFLGDKYEDVFARHTGARPPLPSEAERVLRAEEKKRDWLQRRGIAYLFVVAPDKHSIYPEYLPEYVRKPSREVLADLVMAGVPGRGLPVLDLRPAMLESKTRYGDMVYAKTDSHWSNLGCYDGYRVIMDALARQTGPLKPLALRSYQASAGPAYNLEGLLGLRKHYKMKDVHIRLECDHASPAMRAREFSGAPAPWSGTDEVHYNARLIVSNGEALNRLRVFALRDSFGNRLSVLLNQSFSEVLYTHYNRESLNFEIVDLLLDFRPDVLLFEMVERNLAEVKGVYPPWETPLAAPQESVRLWPNLPPAAPAGPVAVRPGSREEIAIPAGERTGDLLVRLDTDGPVSLEYAAGNGFVGAGEAVQVGGQGPAFVEIRADAPIERIRLTSVGTSGAVSFRKMSDEALRRLYH